jgi:hypothetical protein
VGDQGRQRQDRAQAPFRRQKVRGCVWRQRDLHAPRDGQGSHHGQGGGPADFPYLLLFIMMSRWQAGRKFYSAVCVSVVYL